MLECKSRAWMEIDTTKIAHNVKEIRKLIPKKTKIMAIVKANAYGHGDVVISKELIKCGVDFFGVSSVDEAISLREAGITCDILILGYTPPMHFHYVLKHNLIQTFFSLEYAQKAAAFAQSQQTMMRGHVKIDTGMSRLGVICQDHEYHIDDVLRIYTMAGLQVEGIFSHFSVSDDLSKKNELYTKHQIILFDRVLADVKKAGIHPGVTHLQNSYGILNYPELAYDYVRPGLLFLGVTSNDALEIRTNPSFLPIMQLKANVSLVKTIQPNVSVSYGRNYCSKDVRKIATVSIGYADGYPRAVSNIGAEVLIHGQRATIIGNICMDQLMIDVTHIDQVKEGDVVTLIGEDQGAFLAVDELTRWAKTINNDTLCFFKGRVPRIYKSE